MLLVLLFIVGAAAYNGFRIWNDERRQLARLRQPVDHLAAITPPAVSLAVLTFVYGLSRQDVPGDHPDAADSLAAWAAARGGTPESPTGWAAL